MRRIINYEKGKTISVEGDGINYKLSSPFRIELKITRREIINNIDTILDNFENAEVGSTKKVDSFKDKIKLGCLEIEDYKWINRWSDTAKFGAGMTQLKPLEYEIFGFNLEEKVNGSKNGQEIYTTPEQIFNLFVKKAIKTFRQ